MEATESSREVHARFQLADAELSRLRAASEEDARKHADLCDEIDALRWGRMGRRGRCAQVSTHLPLLVGAESEAAAFLQQSKTDVPRHTMSCDFRARQTRAKQPKQARYHARRKDLTRKESDLTDARDEVDELRAKMQSFERDLAAARSRQADAERRCDAMGREAQRAAEEHRKREADLTAELARVEGELASEGQRASAAEVGSLL